LREVFKHEERACIAECEIGLIEDSLYSTYTQIYPAKYLTTKLSLQESGSQLTAKKPQWMKSRSASTAWEQVILQPCYVVSALATFLRDTPSTRRDLSSKSIETDGSAASIFATRDWRAAAIRSRPD